MGFWSFLNRWWNLPFLVLLGLCAAFVLMQLVGLIGSGADHDAEAPELPGGDADADADTGADAGPPGDLNHDGHLSIWEGLLAFLGVGRVPFMVVWSSLFLCTGFAGIFINRVLFVLAGGRYQGFWLLPVLAVALTAGVLGARLASHLAGKVVDVGGPGAPRKHQLTGKLGVVASAVCDERFGEVRVRDERGNEQLVHARISPGAAKLSRADQVVLVDFDPEREIFSVIACNELDK